MCSSDDEAIANVVHGEDEGRGWTGGVAGWPWKNVGPPYTPIGYLCKKMV